MARYLCLSLVILAVYAVNLSSGYNCTGRNCFNNECLGEGCAHGCESGFASYDGRCLSMFCVNRECVLCTAPPEDEICEKCTYGMYGPDCSLFCAPGCKDYSCDKETGQCSHGCREGFGNEPWCNVNLTDTYDVEASGKNDMTSVPVGADGAKGSSILRKGTSVLVDEDATERNVYIWIASCLISALILAVIVIIIYISVQRKRGWKSYDVEYTRANQNQHPIEEVNEI